MAKKSSGAGSSIQAWITVNGRHIPVMKGESKAQAINRYKSYQKASKSMPTRSKRMIMEDAKATRNSNRRIRNGIRANKQDTWGNVDRKKAINSNKLHMQDLRHEYNRAKYKSTLKSGNTIKKATSINKYTYNKAVKERNAATKKATNKFAKNSAKTSKAFAHERDKILSNYNKSLDTAFSTKSGAARKRAYNKAHKIKEDRYNKIDLQQNYMQHKINTKYKKDLNAINTKFERSTAHSWDRNIKYKVKTSTTKATAKRTTTKKKRK